MNKDILDALELLTHKGFSNDNSIKYITRKTDKISKVNKKLTDKNIFLIDETGDVIFDIIKCKPKRINCHLKNTFSKYYIELKIMFMKKCSYNSYVNFFVKTGDDYTLFNYETYYKISGYLTEATRLFWDALYESTNYTGYKIRNSDLFEQKKYVTNKYVTEKNYSIMKENINNIEINFQKDLEDHKYDYVIVNSELYNIYELYLNELSAKKIIQ